MKFLIDAQLPPALAQWLRAAGHDAVAVREIGLRDAVDDAIWQHALAESRVIMTKDEDFARKAQTEVGPVIVWLRMGNTSNAALAAWIIPQLPPLIDAITQGARVVEVR